MSELMLRLGMMYLWRETLYCCGKVILVSEVRKFILQRKIRNYYWMKGCFMLKKKQKNYALRYEKRKIRQKK